MSTFDWKKFQSELIGAAHWTDARDLSRMSIESFKAENRREAMMNNDPRVREGEAWYAPDVANVLDDLSSPIMEYDGEWFLQWENQQTGVTHYLPMKAYDPSMVGHSQCTCPTVWQSIIPPPPCPVHSPQTFANRPQYTITVTNHTTPTLDLSHRTGAAIGDTDVSDLRAIVQGCNAVDTPPVDQRTMRAETV